MKAAAVLLFFAAAGAVSAQHVVLPASGVRAAAYASWAHHVRLERTKTCPFLLSLSSLPFSPLSPCDARLSQPRVALAFSLRFYCKGRLLVMLNKFHRLAAPPPPILTERSSTHPHLPCSLVVAPLPCRPFSTGSGSTMAAEDRPTVSSSFPITSHIT